MTSQTVFALTSQAIKCLHKIRRGVAGWRLNARSSGERKMALCVFIGKVIFKTRFENRRQSQLKRGRDFSHCINFRLAIFAKLQKCTWRGSCMRSFIILECGFCRLRSGLQVIHLDSEIGVLKACKNGGVFWLLCRRFLQVIV